MASGDPGDSAHINQQADQNSNKDTGGKEPQRVSFKAVIKGNLGH